MTRACVVIAAVLVACAAVPAARAAFSAPVELATAPFVPAAAADTDAAGSTSVVVAGVAGGPLLVQRPAGGAWQAGAPLPGAPPSVVGPVIDAAGDGAL